MSIKQDIDMVKQELNSEEKFFEKAVITEKFVKKYKNLMIGSAVAIVLFAGGNIAYEANKDSNIEDANVAMMTLSQDSTNSAAIAKLKSLSPALYDVWLYSQAMANKDMATLKELSKSKSALIGDLVSYELAQDSKDVIALSDYSSAQGAIYKDLALVQSAVFLINESKVEEARVKLVQISAGSSLSKIAQALLHYGIK